MIATASLPVVRARVSSANVEEYRRRRAPEFAARGVLIPSERLRPIGARVRLKVELADGSLGHDGEAVVVKHVRAGARSGYLLKLTAPGAGDARATPSPDRPVPGLGTASGTVPAPEASPEPTPEAILVPTPEPTPLPASPRRAGADPATGEAAKLADFLFSDLNLADPTHPGRALAAPSASPRTPARLASLAPARAPGEAPRAEPARAGEPAEAAAGGPAPARVTAPTLAVTFEDEPADPALPAPPLVAWASAARAAPTRRFRHPAAIAAAVALCVAVGAGTVLLAAGPTRAEARAADFVAELRRADDRVRAGRLAGTGNDSALDHLAAARELVPDDPRLTRRLKLLADLFGDLGERALARGDLEEAAVHFQARLRAEPGSDAARRRLREIAERTPATRTGRSPGAVGK